MVVTRQNVRVVLESKIVHEAYSTFCCAVENVCDIIGTTKQNNFFETSSKLDLLIDIVGYDFALKSWLSQCI